MRIIQPTEPTDLCCSCGEPVGGAIGIFKPLRLDGHPFCAKPKCYWVKWDQYRGGRKECKCKPKAGDAAL
jgi:hypothetical protein